LCGNELSGELEGLEQRKILASDGGLFDPQVHFFTHVEQACCVRQSLTRAKDEQGSVTAPQELTLKWTDTRKLSSSLCLCTYSSQWSLYESTADSMKIR